MSEKPKILGCFELGHTGRLSKSTNSSNKIEKTKRPSWSYQMEVTDALEAVNAALEGRPAKSTRGSILQKRNCLYCSLELKPGNTSQFCNKRCQQFLAQKGPLIKDEQ